MINTTIPCEKYIIHIFFIIDIYIRGELLQVKPLQISAETAVMLSEKLGVPIEKIMHMPQHILLEKLMELEKEKSEE
jgi:hypothetical protein